MQSKHIHPEKAIAKAIPEAQAEADKQKAENEMKAAQLSAFADAEENSRWRDAQLARLNAPKKTASVR